MKPAERTIEQLQTIWQTRGIAAGELVPDSGGTLVPGLRSSQPSLTRTLDFLPRLAMAGDGIETPELELGPTIGEGGMGVIRLATQVPLAREVAVKTGSPQTTLQLLREARVTGSLEHPNIIPIHALGRDQHGAPILLMKRVDGVPWRELIDNPEHPLRAGDPRDDLDFHLDVLIHVCNAVHFAHSKGIIHRDLKPDNVMIGRFGEVYVLDWGIAVSTRRDPTGVLPLAREVKVVAGTPQYMAPEMVVADGPAITERTDVYLLGAMLHECLTGHARHHGRTLIEILANAYLSVPYEYDESVPAELAAICNRATDADPARRFASAEELRDALAGFQRHRDSASLSRQASLRLDALRTLLASPGEARAAAAEQGAHVLFTECRFGFQQAIRIWPDNPEARSGLEATLQRMVDHQISLGDHQAASVLLRELEHPPPELAERVERLGQQLEQERAKVEQLRRLERDLDLNIGRRTRAFLTLLIAVIFTLLPLLTGLAERLGWLSVSLGMLELEAALFTLFGLIAYAWAYATLTRTEVNRRLVRAVRVLCVAMLLLPLGCWLLAIDARRELVLLQLMFALFLGVLSATIDSRLALAALVYLAAFLAAAALQPWVYEIMAVATAVALLHIVVIWRLPARRPGAGSPTTETRAPPGPGSSGWPRA